MPATSISDWPAASIRTPTLQRLNRILEKYLYKEGPGCVGRNLDGTASLDFEVIMRILAAFCGKHKGRSDGRWISAMSMDGGKRRSWSCE